MFASHDFATGVQLKILARTLAKLYPTAINTMAQTAMWKFRLGKIRR
jgi:hypothetical protein